MEYIKNIIERYKQIRSMRQLKQIYGGNYAFVGIGNHSTNNLYPVLNYLHVPLKYICCKSEGKLPFIEAAYPNVCATTSLDDILHDDDIKGVFVSVSPQSHFTIASKVIKSGKALFIEKPPCQSEDELLQLIEMRKAAGFPQVTVGLQKRNAPVIRILKKELQKSKGRMSYNLKYLTGSYPEGDAMLDLFVHPLDYVTFLFGKAEVKFAGWIEHHTLMLVLEHEKATGVLELSTGYSWNDAKECMTVNTSSGIFEMEQMESLIYKGKQSTLMGVPVEKVYQRKRVDVHLFDRNNFVPTIHNNQIVTQGYFDTIKSFVDAVEKRKSSSEQSLEAIIDTYKLIESIRSIQN